MRRARLTVDALAVWHLEERFWRAGRDHYRDNLTDEALMVFPPPVGVLTKAATLAAIAAAPRWVRVAFTDQRLVTPAPDTAILNYAAAAHRAADDAPYTTRATSVYVRRAGRWWLAFHQQCPLPDGGKAMDNSVYTLGVWHVKPGREAEFVAAWTALGQVFATLPSPPGTGSLIQSMADPQLFYSFGPWRRLEHVQAMRSHPGAQAALRRVVVLCTDATPGTFRLVAQVPGADGGPRP